MATLREVQELTFSTGGWRWVPICTQLERDR
jgi:hypothetical protein